jgi:arabinose-5-phosphate isomerase
VNSQTILKRAAEVLRIESGGILSIAERLDKNFVRAVELLEQCAGKVVVTGMGKSGLICRKIAATLASTGTPAFFLHAADALHGDLGMIKQGDVVLAISNSGETDEILKLLPHIRHYGLKLVVMTGNLESSLAKAGDVVLDVRVPEEACPLGLAPTASTTAALAMGDALAVVVLERKGFKEEDFALRHPGGILGRRLLLRVAELMHRGEELPLVSEETLMKEALFEITSKRLGIVGVVNAAGQLVGVVTDGDLRRGLQKHGEKILNKRADELMTRNPRTIGDDALASDALVKMEDPQRPITALFVLENHSRKPIGVIHIHDILKAGL